jgi:transcriptional regulator with XRE-family HTH domain
VRTRQKQIFGQRITRLATERSLVTNDQLGEFLGVSGEQARKLKAGENKPQLATLKNIADRFKVSVEYLIGLSDER